MEFRWYSRREDGFADACRIRKRVFCGEVGFSEEFEFDSRDRDSLHLVLCEGVTPVGAARITRGEGNAWRFGRLCCLPRYRGRGFGKALLREAVRKCLILGADRITLGAKYDKRKFYRAAGFAERGEVFYEEGIPHVNMERDYRDLSADREIFDIPQHANLFALIYRRARTLYGPRGRRAADRGTMAYGRQRGRRMAERAKRDGAPLNMESYLLYGEWEDKNRRSRNEDAPTFPRYRTHVARCGWCEAWKESGLLEYGKNYCTYVDKNLVRGFNPRLNLEIETVLSQGGDRCRFVWNGFSVETREAKAAFARKGRKLGRRKLKDFLYHTGHLLRAMDGAISRELGAGKAALIKEKALRDFREMYGREQTRAVIIESRQDFTVVDY